MTLTRECSLVAERIVPGGDALARDDAGVVFIAGALPGEHVRVVVDHARGGVRRGRVLAVLQASAGRVEPDCALHPHARSDEMARDARAPAACGGCDLLHASATLRSTILDEIVRDALRRVGRFSDDELRVVQAVRTCPGTDAAPDAMRRRARFVVDDAGRLSFSAPRSHARVPIGDCAALHPSLRAVVGAMPRLARGLVVQLACDDDGVVAAIGDARGAQDAARGLVRDGIVRGCVVVDDGRDDGPARGGAHDVLCVGESTLVGEVTAGLLPCRSDAATFAQATRFGGATIRDLVVEAVQRHAPGGHVLELFSGAGHLSFALAQAGCTVDAVEGDGRGARFLDDNARHFGDGRVRGRRAFIDGSLATGDRDADVVVADPPRTGIVGFAQLARRLMGDALVLVSCDPATGARDLRHAVDAGYVLQALAPIAAFPRTHHVEWVAQLTR